MHPNSHKSWYIVGTGMFARKVAFALLGKKEMISCFLDEDRNANSPIANIPSKKFNLDEIESGSENFFVAVGNAEIRKRLIESICMKGWKTPSVIHPTSWVAPDAVIEDGSFIGANAVIESGSIVKRGSIIDIGCMIDHECTIAEFSHVKPGTILQPRQRWGFE